MTRRWLTLLFIKGCATANNTCTVLLFEFAADYDNGMIFHVFQREGGALFPAVVENNNM